LVKDHFVVDFSAGTVVTGDVKISLTDSRGAIVSHAVYNYVPDQRLQVKLEGTLAPGLYYVNIETLNGHALSKIIIAD
jgi:hypothetical protein